MQDMRSIIGQVRENPTLIDQYGYLSTAEWLILCLGVGTKESIAKLGRYPTIAEAWQRIGYKGQTIVTEIWQEG
jgi:hypothetical protein